jgi:putative lipoic acid-binding regulatory protein
MTQKKPEIQFPCRWEFRLITMAEKTGSVRNDIENIGKAENICFETADGQSSESGKYNTIRTACTVGSIEQARSLADKFSKLDGVRFLI